MAWHINNTNKKNQFHPSAEKPRDRVPVNPQGLGDHFDGLQYLNTKQPSNSVETNPCNDRDRRVYYHYVPFKSPFCLICLCCFHRLGTLTSRNIISRYLLLIAPTPMTSSMKRDNNHDGKPHVDQKPHIWLEARPTYLNPSIAGIAVCTPSCLSSSASNTSPLCHPHCQFRDLLKPETVKRSTTFDFLISCPSPPYRPFQQASLRAQGFDPLQTHVPSSHRVKTAH